MLSRHSIGRRLIKSNDEPIKYLWNRMQAAQSTSNPSCSFPAMVTPCLPLGDPLEGWFCALVEHTFIYIYIHTYMCIYTSTRALYCIKRNAENALRSNPLARWSLLTPLLLASLVPSFSLLSLSLDDFDPLGYGQFFSRISSEVSKHGKARARWTRRAN